MKNFFKAFFVGVLFLTPLLSLSPTYAQEGLNIERITLFKSDIQLDQNTDIKIREEIHYFFPIPKRGIIREIPVDYKVQAALRRPTILVLDEVYYYPVNEPTLKRVDYKRSKKSGYEIFKIGNPNITIQGEYVYVIQYSLKNTINYFDDHDELFLNITGNGWSVPIETVSANIEVPGTITDTICFTGPKDSTASECTFEKLSDTQIVGTTTRALGSLEGYTVALKMPKDTLKDTRAEQTVAFLLANIGIFLPIPFFFFFLFIINKKGKNKKITVIPHYEPEKGMYPLLAGYIHSSKLDNKHITAEIIQLAIEGHIRIKQEGKRNYILEKTQVEKDITRDSSRMLYAGLFNGSDSVNTKKISSSFYYLTVQNLSKELDSVAYDEGYFEEKRKKLRNRMSTFGILGSTLSFMTFGYFSELAATGWSIGFLLSSILAIIFSSKVNLKAKKGSQSYCELEGLKMYIDTAEKHRIEFHNDPEKYRGVFETLLPYAIIFGLEKKWASEFKDIYKEPPDWYQGNMNTFNSYYLANSISNIGRSVKFKSTAPNSAGGFTSSHGGSGGSGFSGGSSGGGSGGGGGSSW